MNSFNWFPLDVLFLLPSPTWCHQNSRCPGLYNFFFFILAIHASPAFFSTFYFLACLFYAPKLKFKLWNTTVCVQGLGGVAWVQVAGHAHWILPFNHPKLQSGFSVVMGYSTPITDSSLYESLTEVNQVFESLESLESVTQSVQHTL